MAIMDNIFDFLYESADEFTQNDVMSMTGIWRISYQFGVYDPIKAMSIIMVIKDAKDAFPFDIIPNFEAIRQLHKSNNFDNDFKRHMQFNFTYDRFPSIKEPCVALGSINVFGIYLKDEYKYDNFLLKEFISNPSEIKKTDRKISIQEKKVSFTLKSNWE